MLVTIDLNKLVIEYARLKNNADKAYDNYATQTKIDDAQGFGPENPSDALAMYTRAKQECFVAADTFRASLSNVLKEEDFNEFIRLVGYIFG